MHTYIQTYRHTYISPGAERSIDPCPADAAVLHPVEPSDLLLLTEASGQGAAAVFLTEKCRFFFWWNL